MLKNHFKNKSSITSCGETGLTPAFLSAPLFTEAARNYKLMKLKLFL
jgi:hypothetical protein